MIAKKTREGRLSARNKKIQKRFQVLCSKRHKSGVRLYTTDAVLAMLSDEFYLSSRTIEDILSRS